MAYIVTEAGERVTTEAGEFLVTEDHVAVITFTLAISDDPIWTGTVTDQQVPA